MKKILLASVMLLVVSSAASAGGYYTPGLPQVLSLTGSEQFPLDTEYPNGISPQTGYVTGAQLAGMARSTQGSNNYNSLICGDFGTCPWQRGTTTGNFTTVLTYGPDRWWGLSGTSTQMKITKQTGAGDILRTYNASARVQRNSGQTGVLPVCAGQLLLSINSSRFRGQRAEFVFWALAGANFSAASSAISATIGYATSTNGSAANFAAASLTGQVNTTSVIAISTTWTRYSVVADVPSTASQIGVSLCFTPVGTAGTNDWFEFAGAQLDVNPVAVALTGTTNVTGQGGFAASFSHRDAMEELLLAQQYYWALNEPASGAAISAMCQATGATANICNVNLPVTMWQVPTIAITTAGTFKVNIAGTPTTIVSPTASTCSQMSCAVTAGNTNTAGQAELLSGGGGTGFWEVSAEL